MQIFDEDAQFRQALARSLREQFPSLRVEGTGELASGLGMFRSEKPKVVMIDLDFCGGIGLGLAEYLLNEAPETTVGLLSSHVIPELYRRAAFRCGIQHLLLKDALDWAELKRLAVADGSGTEGEARHLPERRVRQHPVPVDRRAS